MGKRERDQFITKIRNVFQTREPPEEIVGDKTRYPVNILKKKFLGKKWTEINLEDVMRYRDDLSLLNHDGFVYYFPGFLTFALEDPEETDFLVENLVFQLAQENWYKNTVKGDAIVDLFTVEEQNLIKEFLLSYTELFDEPHWTIDREDTRLLLKALKHWIRFT